MLNFLGQAVVTALKVTATRAANDACRSGYNAAKRKISQKSGTKHKQHSKTSKGRKTSNSTKARSASASRKTSYRRKK